MKRRIPIFATLMVAAAVATMIALGIWQLRRAQWKEGLLARYAAAETLPPIAFPTVPLRDDGILCAVVRARAGFTRVDAQPPLSAPTGAAIHVWQSDVDRINGALPITEAPGVTITKVGAVAGRGCG